MYPNSEIEVILKREKRKQKARNYASLAFFLGPFLVSFIVLFVFPFILGLVMSLSKFDGRSFLPSEFVGLDNFKALFTNRALIKDFWGSVWITFRFAIIIVPLSLVIPFLLALLVHQEPPGYKLFRAFIYIPGIFPLTATGLILLKMFSFQNGFVNNFFGLSLDWFGETRLAWLMVGLFCISLYEVAQVDGSSKWRQFIKITIPGIRYQILLTLFTTFIGYMNLYGQLFILASNTPDQDAMKSAVFRIQDMLMGTSRSYGYAAAMGVCLGILIAIFSILQIIVTKDRKGGEKHGKAFMAWQKLQ